MRHQQRAVPCAERARDPPLESGTACESRPASPGAPDETAAARPHRRSPPASTIPVPENQPVRRNMQAVMKQRTALRTASISPMVLKKLLVAIMRPRSPLLAALLQKRVQRHDEQARWPGPAPPERHNRPSVRSLRAPPARPSKTHQRRSHRNQSQIHAVSRKLSRRQAARADAHRQRRHHESDLYIARRAALHCRKRTDPVGTARPASRNRKCPPPSATATGRAAGAWFRSTTSANGFHRNLSSVGTAAVRGMPEAHRQSRDRHAHHHDAHLPGLVLPEGE